MAVSFYYCFDRNGETVETIVRCERFLKGAYRRGGESWPVFDLLDFVESNLFLQAAAD